MKIKHKLLIAVFCVTILPMTLILILLMQIGNTRTTRIFENNMTLAVDAQIAAMDNYYYNILSDNEEIANIPTVQNLLSPNVTPSISKDDSDFLNELLMTRTRVNKSIESITIIKADMGIVACSEVTDVKYLPLEKIRDYKYDNHLSVSNIMASTLSERVIVTFYEIVEDNKVLGYIIMALNISYFDNMVDSLQLWDNSSIHFLDDNLEHIAFATKLETKKTEITNLTEEELQEKIQRENQLFQSNIATINFDSEPRGTFVTKMNNGEYKTQYAACTFNNWIVLFTVNMDTQMNTRQTATAVFGLISITILMCATAIALVFRRIINRPLNTLADTMIQIHSTNDYSERVKVFGKDEIGIVAKEVNRLLGFVERDVAFREKQNNELRLKAERDGLSGLLNRESTAQRIESAIKQAQPEDYYCLMVIDFDNFKAVNDSFGHQYGDLVIKQFSDRLKDTFRETDVVGLIGGDEFFVLLKNYSDRGIVEKKASAVCGILSDINVKSTNGTNFSSSVGIALYPQDATTFEELYNAADKALYAAKTKGKNTFAFYSEGLSNEHYVSNRTHIDSTMELSQWSG